MSQITTCDYNVIWSLKDLQNVKSNKCKVFGTFVCGGGSAMGYKLAGYDYLGGLEFLEKYADIYDKNLHPKYLFREDIRNFNLRNDLPGELYNLDILDGSPPCAAFSLSGRREQIWGKKSKYEEVQQRKDDLLFVYIETIEKLMPRVFLLENVKGLSIGNAKAYLYQAMSRLSSKYRVQVFILNSAIMGVPQARERLFIIGLRKDIDLPKLELSFNCEQHPFSETKPFWDDPDNSKLSIKKYAIAEEYDKISIGHSSARRFNLSKPSLDKPCPTLLASNGNLSISGIVHPTQKRKLNKRELLYCSTFPQDYDFGECTIANVVGRAVPPIMMAQISSQIYKQWLSKL